MTSKAVARSMRAVGGVAAVLLLVAAAELAGLVSSLDRHLTDLRFRIDHRPATGDVVLVDIDAESLARVGVWPWPRQLHADLVDAAAHLGAERIAFDVDFSAASSQEADAAFAAALKRTPASVFLAAFVQSESAATWKLLLSLPIEPLLQSAWPALVNVPIDADGKVRRFPSRIHIGGEELAAMPVVLADGPAANAEIGIDFGIDPSTLPRVSFIDVVKGNVAKDFLKGKTVIVGATALELRDLFAVPARGIVSGSTIIALATESILQGRDLGFTEPSWPVELALLVVSAVVLGCRRTWRVVLAFAAFGALVEAVALFLHAERAIVLETARLHVAFLGFAGTAVLREIYMRGRLLWQARVDAANQRALLERVVEDGFDGVLVLDGSTRIARINDVAKELLGTQAGGFDNLPDEVRTAVHEALDGFAAAGHLGRRTLETTIRRDGNASRVVECSVSALRFEQADPSDRRSLGNVFVCIALRDVTSRRLAEEALRRAAFEDSLTGLGNRRAFEVNLAARSGEAASALIAFDLDRFKVVNDTLGHAVGDSVLIETARRAGTVFTDAFAVGRTGGDEFCVAVPAETRQAALRMAEAVASAIAEPFFVAGHRLLLNANVGVSWEPAGPNDDRAMHRADAALRFAKSADERRPALFDANMETRRLERLAIERDLGQALRAGEFELFYQPQFGLASGDIVGAEALLRWRHPVRGLVRPDLFVPILEETGLIHQVGAWALTTACREATRWPTSMKVAVNVSSVQFAAGDLVGAVEDALSQSRLPPARLEIEITESAFVAENDRLSGIFDRLLGLGVSFSLDDFGTGYSSLGYLHRFPISKIKVDRSFVTGIPTDGNSMAILRSVRALADGLGLRLIAEGIETEAQAETLRIMGFDDAQGFLFAKPIGPESLPAFFTVRRASPDAEYPRLAATA